jgi:hypothetical protein
MTKRDTHPMTTRNDLEMAIIAKIADRAVNMYAQHDVRVDRQDVLLDVLVTHRKVMPLRLADLLDADDLNFAHDISGINRHLDRDNYALMDGFRPRFCERQVRA